MTDYRFPAPGVDARFPGGGVDAYFPSPGVSGRFPSPGVDLRFMAPGFGGGPALPADYTVTNTAEWNVVAAESAATLSGKIVEFVGTDFPSVLSLSNKTMDASLVLRGAAGARVTGFSFTGITNLQIRDLAIQMTGWPRLAAGLIAVAGTNADWKIGPNVSFRHGYGSSRVNLDPVAIESYPEIVRVPHVLTATTSAQRITITTSPASGAPSWWIEFFNRGANGVYVKGGDGTVTATAADLLVPAGGYARLNASHTHVSVLAVTGTSEVNARSEVGLNSYLASAFSSGGGVTTNNFEIVGCTFTDLSNVMKSFGIVTGRVVFWKNFGVRNYQDIISHGINYGETEMFWHLNDFEVPLARSGIAEAANGDARDPHGDLRQTFTDDSQPVTAPFYAAGNTSWPNSRSGSGAQGDFISDGGYRNVALVGNLNVGGAARGASIGDGDTEALGAGYTYIDGLTCLNMAVPTSASNILLYQAPNRNNIIRRSIAASFTSNSETTLANNTTFTGLNTSIFADFAAAQTATSKAAILAALNTPSLTAGAVALRSTLINEAATTPEGVIRWENTIPAIAWPSVPSHPAGTLYTGPLRRVLGGTSSMSISAVAGTEYQITSDEAGLSVVQAWTDSSRTVGRGRFVQVRGNASSTGATTVNLSVVISGITFGLALTSASTASYVTIDNQNAAYSRVAAPVSSDTGVRRLVIAARFRPDVLTTSANMFADGGASTIRFWTPSTTTFRFQINGSTIQLRPTLTATAAFKTHLITLDLTQTTAAGANWATIEDGMTLTGSVGTSGAFNTIGGTLALNMNTNVFPNSLGIFAEADGGGVLFDGAFEFFWMDWGDSGYTIPDITNSTVRNSWLADNIGANGQGPTGSTPKLYYSAADLTEANSVGGIPNRGSIASVPLVKQAGTYA